jgi:hypothetical protein
MGTCPLLAPIFARSQRFLEVTQWQNSSIGGVFGAKMSEKPRQYWSFSFEYDC